MKVLNNEKEILDLINNNSMSIVYFTGVDCGACEVIKIKIEGILKRYPLIMAGEISGEKHISISAKYEVFSLPLCILYIEGKESLRYGRNIDILNLEEHIDRYYSMIF